MIEYRSVQKENYNANCVFCENRQIYGEPLSVKIRFFDGVFQQNEKTNRNCPCTEDNHIEFVLQFEDTAHGLLTEADFYLLGKLN